jgi:selenocysteine lyase/cysteine desulfurase
MDFAGARSLFPGTRDRVFLDSACVSLMPSTAGDALQSLSQQLLSCSARDASAHHIALDRTAGLARQKIAQLIGARPDDIALVESTTHGLEIVAAVVPLQEGEKILVGETEFLGVTVPWVARQKRVGFEIEVVPARSGRLLADDFARAIDSQTRMILLSSVQWSNGFRADLASFVNLARERNVLLVVDAIQQLGAIALDVSRTPVDFLVCGGHKWLNAPAGRGFLYVDPQLAKNLEPPAWGYLNIDEPPEGWAAYFATPTIPAVRQYSFTASARKFEIGGTANYPGNVVLAASVGLINELGIRKIEEHVLELSDLLIDRLRGANMQIVSPLERNGRSGILTFTQGAGAVRDRQLLEYLLDRRILISQRYTAGIGGLRVSMHLFNNDDDIERLAKGVVKFARDRHGA